MTVSGAEVVRSVSDVANSLRNYIGQLPDVWIEGQLAEWNPRAKAHYGKLKDIDGDASINITATFNEQVLGTSVLTVTLSNGSVHIELARPLLAQRLRFMAGLANWPSFSRGWSRRMADLMEA